jgi:hypothetical protein
VGKKKGKVEPPTQDSSDKEEVDHQEFVKYLTVRNSDDVRVTNEMVECFIGSMSGETVKDLRDVFEVFLKLDRHATEFWSLKNKRNSN